MNLKSCFFILTFVLSLCTLACSSTDTQFQEISKQEFDEAFKQYQTYNLVADTMAVDSATRTQIVNKIKQHYHQWKALIDVFQVGKVHKTGEYMAIVVGVTGELFIHLFNKNAQLIPVDSVLNDRLPMEYHAYSKDSLFEDSCTETRGRKTEIHSCYQRFYTLFSTCLGGKKHRRIATFHLLGRR